MGLVRIRRIRHGVARHVMESRVHAYKKTARKAMGGKRTGGAFLPFADTENQFLSTFDTPSPRNILTL